jgi:NodT family efflux transporter outer membrane factor (OMF) lipoprotein
MNRPQWAALAAAAITAGCVAVPQRAAPAPAVAAAWQAPPPGGASDWPAGWDGFNDPLLPELIAAAQAASPTLAAAAARIGRARATRAAAGAALVPQLAATGTASKGRTVPGLDLATSTSLGLQASWEIDLFGGAAAGRSAAQARLEGAAAGWHDALIAVAAETATAYTTLRACEAQLVQARADAASRAETARLTGLSEQAGFTAPADAALARAGAAQARSQATDQQAACETLLKSLVELTDLDEPGLRQRLAAGTARVPQPAPITVTLLPAALLARRPDLVDAARAVAAAAADQAQAQAGERPQISLAGAIASASLGTAAGTTRGTTWSLGPLVVNFPLFDGGARVAATAASRAAYDEAVALYRARVRRAVREVETSFVSLQSSATRQDDAVSAARDFESSLRATAARQRGGLASLFELEAARRNAVAAQAALIELQRERAVAWITLYRALGGGWTGADLASAAPATAGP